MEQNGKSWRIQSKRLSCLRVFGLPGRQEAREKKAQWQDVKDDEGVLTKRDPTKYLTSWSLVTRSWMEISNGMWAPRPTGSKLEN